MNKVLDYEGLKLLVSKLLSTIEMKKHEKIFMIDNETGYEYAVELKDGEFISYCVHEYDDIIVSTPPNKIEYTAGEKFDPTGMVVSLIDTDGSVIEVKDYTCTDYINTDTVNISYTINNIEYNTSINITLNPINPDELLMDFEYIANDDGTYTITAWKNTLNGEPSTECIVPDNALINI